MKKVLKSLTMVLLVLTVIIGGVGCNKKNTKSNEN